MDLEKNIYTVSASETEVEDVRTLAAELARLEELVRKKYRKIDESQEAIKCKRFTDKKK
jgi:hypothetical protein